MMDCQRHIEILKHTLGDKTMYRNHFAANSGHSDYQALLECVKLGWMTMKEAPFWMGEYNIFHATDEGKKIALKDWAFRREK